MEIKRVDEKKIHPWLLISEKEKQFFYNVIDNRFHTTYIPELLNKYVFGCAFGWLILADMSTKSCCLWHPMSWDKIELPELTQPSMMYDKCLLSKSPIQPDCHILFIASNSLSRDFCQIGDNQFVTQTSTYEDVEKMSCLSAFVRFKGKIYGIVVSCYCYRFVTIDFVGRKLELNPLLKEGGEDWNVGHPSGSRAMGHADYLIESPCGKLLWVHKVFLSLHLEDSFDFRVFWVDIDRRKCSEVINIGQTAIFVSHQGDAFCCSSSGIKPNSIYYNAPDSMNLFIYDLGDKSTTALLPCSIATKFNTSRYWVPPNFFLNFLN